MEIAAYYPPVEIKKVETILKQFDTVLVPALSQRVDIKDYAWKLAQNAVMFYVHEKEKVLGHCAVYTNNQSCTYISSIAVMPEVQGKGIGRILWECVEKEACIRGISKIKLEVYGKNITAVRFYQEQGCRVICKKENWLTMIKDLIYML